MGPYGSQNFKMLLLPQFLSNFKIILLLQFSSNVSQTYEDIGYHGGIQAINFLAIGQVLEILCHIEILTWEAIGNPKMWNILKLAYRRAKHENLGLWVLWFTYVGYFLCPIA